MNHIVNHWLIFNSAYVLVEGEDIEQLCNIFFVLWYELCMYNYHVFCNQLQLQSVLESRRQ